MLSGGLWLGALHRWGGGKSGRPGWACGHSPGRHAVRGSPQGPTAQHTQAETQRDQRRVPILVHGLWHKDPHPQSPAQTWDRESGVGAKRLRERDSPREGRRQPRVVVARPGCAGRHSTGSTPGVPHRRRAARGRRGEGHSPRPRSARRWGLSQRSREPAQAAGLPLCLHGSATPPASASGSRSR